MATEFTVRPFVDSDLEPTLETLRASMGSAPGVDFDEALFSWKHLDNPFGRSIMLVADAGEVIAGFRAFMRWDLTTPSGETIKCVRAVDTATHPGFQRRGIFRTLTLAALDEARDAGIDLVFNTPNPKSGAGYLSMGWRDVGHVGAMVRPGLAMLTRASDGIPPLEAVFDDPVLATGLTVHDRPPRGLRTPRTPAYLAWRFARPQVAYAALRRSESTAVVRPNVRNGRVEIVVADVFGPHPAAAIRAAAQRAKTGYLAGWFAAGSPERRAAVAAGMLPVPVKTLCLVANPLRALPVDVTDLSNWDFATSDLELL